ncbi:MAG: Tim44 domain-containing protein [Alphaproteobacteria bacterium]|nr:Tim44 domain-containing protein [Alphaproteobacteria bacterium]
MIHYLDLLVLLIVVIFIFQKLFSVLGTRNIQEKRIRLSKENAEKLYNILKNEADKMQMEENNSAEPMELKPLEETENLSDTDKILIKIPNFKKDKFLKSAENAFRIITTAFNQADVETLEMLLNKNLLKKFQDVIENRKQNKISAETDFIGFDKVEIIKAQIKDNNVAEIAVEFVSEQVNILRDADGNVIEGDENYIQNITDIWTFERAISSASPNWILVSTKK